MATDIVMLDESHKDWTPDQLTELYKIAVEEYRFQVNLNTQRSRDYFILNSAIIGSAVALLGQRATFLAGTVFAAGFFVALLTGFGTHTQHNYYREASATKRMLERRLGIRDLVVRTTPSAGSRRWRLGSVTQFNYIIIAMLCLVNILGLLFSFSVLPFPQARQSVTQSETRSAPPSPQLEPRQLGPAKTPGSSPASDKPNP